MLIDMAIRRLRWVGGERFRMVAAPFQTLFFSPSRVTLSELAQTESISQVAFMVSGTRA